MWRIVSRGSEISLPGLFGQYYLVPDWDYMCDKLGYVLILRKYQYYLKSTLFADSLKSLAQLLTSFLVQSYKRVVHNDDAWVAHECTAKDEFA